MTDSKAGYLAKVTLGANKVLGIGVWSMDGMTIAELDNTEFGDKSTKYVLGIQDGGTITFAGNHKPGDTTGQDKLLEYWDARSQITSMRFYIDETSYYEPCQTTSYLHPAWTSTANTVLSSVLMTAAPINYDKGALGQIGFTVRVNGNMVLV